VGVTLARVAAGWWPTPCPLKWVAFFTVFMPAGWVLFYHNLEGVVLGVEVYVFFFLFRVWVF
jgi:hypothetical protein